MILLNIIYSSDRLIVTGIEALIEDSNIEIAINTTTIIVVSALIIRNFHDYFNLRISYPPIAKEATSGFIK